MGIICPTCSKANLKRDNNVVYCPKCGYIIKIDYIKKIYDIFFPKTRKKLNEFNSKTI
uniref:Putative replication protein n=1 Tax=viral metagenome TaxID=1070528 RepID=A0A6H1ZQU6_9ZZZZ